MSEFDLNALQNSSTTGRRSDASSTADASHIQNSDASGLRRVVRNGVFWTMTQSSALQVMTFVIFLILARLVEPAAFGLIALAAVYIHLSSIFVEQGLATAIVQRRNLDSEHLDAAFWISTTAGLTLCLVGWAASGFIASIFGTPDLQPVVALLSLTLLLNSLNGVQQAILRRAFEFRSIALRWLIATAAGGIIGIALALKGFGVYALVAHQIATAAVGVLVLWTVGKWRPRMIFSWRHARDLLSFSTNMLGLRLVNVTRNRVADLLIGLMLGPIALGYYYVGSRVFKTLVDLVGKVFSKVAVPTFAVIQDQRNRVRSLFYRGCSIIAFLSAPIFTLLILLAPDIVPVFFGEQWIPSVPIVQVLAILGILHVLAIFSDQTVIALGRPAWILALQGLGTFVALLGIMAVASHGIVAVAVAVTLASYAILPVRYWIMHQLFAFRASDFLSALRGPALGTLALIGISVSIRNLFAEVVPTTVLVAGTAIGAAIGYLMVVRIAQPSLIEEVVRMARRTRNDRKLPREVLAPPVETIMKQ